LNRLAAPRERMIAGLRLSMRPRFSLTDPRTSIRAASRLAMIQLCRLQLAVSRARIMGYSFASPPCHPGAARIFGLRGSVRQNLDAAHARRELAVIRGGFDKPVVYTIDLEQALLVDDRIALRPGDRVVVAPTGLSTSSKYMLQILPFLQGAQAAGIATQGASTVVNQVSAAAN